MKPFVFRLESVMTLRAREESQAREVFGQALAYRQEALRDLENGQAELAAAQQAITDLRDQTSKGPEQMLLIRAWRWHSESCQRLELALSAADQIVERRRQEFIAARQKHQALEKLKEKQQREYGVVLQRHQENEIGDFITARHGRNESAMAGSNF